MALLLAAYASAAELEFSHKKHLAQGLPCATCHSAAETSEQATDRLLPAAETCLACHNGETAPEIDVAPLAEKETAPRTFRFNHQFHLGMGNVAPIIKAALEAGNYLGHPGDIAQHLNTEDACQACHRGLAESDHVSAANLPRMSDCLACHSKVENPFSCEKCHLEGIELMPADHTRPFVDAHSTGVLSANEKISCQPCHGKKFRCMGCH